MNDNNNELYRAIDCRHYLISTNGNHHHHPHPEAVARILDNSRERPHLYFNYRSGDNKMWLDDQTSRDLLYTFHCPREGDEGYEVEL